MPDSWPIAIAAQEAARSAHYRLDRMNGSIDKLTDEIGKVNTKSDQILIKLAREDATEEVAREYTSSGTDSRRFLITSALIFLSSSAGAAIVTLLLHH